MSKVSSLDTDTKPRKETALQLALLALIVMVLGFVVWLIWWTPQLHWRGWICKVSIISSACVVA